MVLEDPRLAEVARLVQRRRHDQGTFIVGVTGGVACGKTTFSGALQARLAPVEVDMGPE